ncbi:MAG TPA: cytochrome P450 [Steroidobacteraceae bacterium]|nr:cytochrome P450 [Steroidobacteraceae bacterium]
MRSALVFDPLSAEFRANSLAVYRRFLREDPVHRIAAGSWLICRHRDVYKVLIDTVNVRRSYEFSVQRVPEGPFREFQRYNLVAMNPPQHTRLRGVLAQAFSPARIRQLSESVDAVAERLLARLEAKSSGDMSAELAFPLPIEVICTMLGIPAQDQQMFREQGAALISGLERTSTPDEQQRAADASATLFAYLSEIAAARQREPGDDLISVLVAHQAAGDMTHEEVVFTGAVLLLAGHETTTHLIGNGIAALIEHPGEFQRLAREPERVANAVQEFLRYDPSIFAIFRDCTAELTFGDVTVPAGSRMTLALAAANRDPEVFQNPDTLDIARPNASRHLSFAGGIHLCLGQALARIESQIVFRKLVEKFSSLSFDGTPERRRGLTFNGYDRLPVTWTRRAA